MKTAVKISDWVGAAVDRVLGIDQGEVDVQRHHIEGEERLARASALHVPAWRVNLPSEFRRVAERFSTATGVRTFVFETDKVVGLRVGGHAVLTFLVEPDGVTVTSRQPGRGDQHHVSFREEGGSIVPTVEQLVEAEVGPLLRAVRLSSADRV